MENKRQPKKSPFEENPDLMFGWNVGVGLVTFFVLGYLADRGLGTGYLWTFVGIGVGVLYLIFEIWKLIRKNSAKSKNGK